jgi:hypothetical protein
MESIQVPVKHTFEFRLLGSEVQSQSLELPLIPSSHCIVVVTDQVRTFVTRSGEPAAASNLIGGVKVSAEQSPKVPERPECVVCTAEATDFGSGDLVVVGVDITVLLVGCDDMGISETM